ncbi:SHOCT domain-containing protein, partial [Streptomyces decoyicus]|uniref:SHOCT domain-containing protein n=1 Tax=Streptomyces decoyicus TaxID=249567 RepID=UPI0006C69B54
PPGPHKPLPAGTPAPAALPPPAPEASPQPAGTGSTAAADDHDALLRRLRELGGLRREGILTEEEFTATKAAVLRRFHTTG